MRVLTVVFFWIMMTCAFLGFSGHNALAQGSNVSGPSPDKLPSDVHADSYARMPRTKKEDFATEEEKKAFEELVGAVPQLAAPGRSLGPTAIRSRNPELAQAYRKIFALLRGTKGLETKYYEQVVLIATRETDNEHEWMDHEPNGIKLLGAEVVENIRNKKDYRELKGLDPKQTILFQYAQELFHQHKVSSKTFADLERLFGRETTLSIALLMGYYTSNTMLLQTYDQHLDPSRKRPFPDVIARE